MKIPRKQFVADVPAMAMGDIAFLLLIFFVILARASDDSHLQWKPADAENLEPAGTALASVVIDSDFHTYLNGRRIEVTELSGQLEGILGGTEAGKRKVLFKVDREAKAKDFEPAIEAISIAGGEMVHILEQDQEPNTQP